jgi:hypothetical protein
MNWYSKMIRLVFASLIIVLSSVVLIDAGEIDHAFIDTLEGGQILEGYVPQAITSKSGVTIASGVDLGSRTEAKLNSLGLDPSLVTRLKPYLGLKKATAKNYEDANPLVISKADADALDKAVKAAVEKELATKYDAAISASAKKFSDLPSQAMTVLFSVEYHYGDLSARTPKFWGMVTKQDWKSAVRELWNFGDDYETRRFKEGDLLSALVSDLPAISKSVGIGGSNEIADVKTIQTLLKQKNVYSGQITGDCDAATIASIKSFQKSIGFATPDGLVSPGKKTFRRLVAF